MFIAFLAAASVIPVQPPQSWFSKADYPSGALSHNAEGTVWADLSVSALGEPIQCKVTLPASEPSLNKRTCDILLKRARFTVTNEGNAQSPQHYTAVVKWVTDTLKLDPIASGSISDFDVTNDRIVNCREHLFGDEKIGLGDACEGINGGPKKLLEYLMDTRLGPISKGALRAYFEPVVTSSVEVLPPSPATIATLAQAEFDVLPTGAIANCRTLLTSDRLPHRDLCELLDSPDTRFSAPAKGQTIRMRIVLDLWVS